jgi:CheY-like chemotaxis protein
MSGHRIVIVGQRGFALARELLALGNVLQHLPSCRRLGAGLPSGSWDACVLVVDQLTAHDANLIRHARETQPHLAVLLSGRDEPGTLALARLVGADDTLLPGHPRMAARRIAQAIARRQSKLLSRGEPTPSPAPVMPETPAIYEALVKRNTAELAERVTHEIDNPATYVIANLTAMSESLCRLIGELREQPLLANRMAELDDLAHESLTGMARIHSITRDLHTAARVGELEGAGAESPRPAAGAGARPSEPLYPPSASQTRPRVLGEAPPSAGTSAQRLRLLLIDDEPLVLRSLRRMLAQHSVVIANGGADALSKLTSRSDYDLVLCDLMMPDMDGTEVHAAIKRRFPHLLDRLVFFTGGALTSRTRAFVEQSSQPLVHKPVTPATFAELAERVLARSQAARAKTNG